MATELCPRSDLEARNRMKQFAETISKNPCRYMLSEADSLAISAAVERYVVAFDRATNSLTRTSAAVISKDESRNAAEQICRLYASQIKVNAGICDADKQAIHVTPVNPNRSRRNAPTSLPSLNIVGALTGSHTLIYCDSLTETRRAKPFAAAMLEVVMTVADEPGKDVTTAKPCGLYTRTPFGVAFEHRDNKKVATYWGRWVTRRGETGPWSMPVHMTIAA